LSKILCFDAFIRRSPIKAGFPLILRELRKHKIPSRAELGNLAGLHFTHVGRYGRRMSRVSADTSERIAEVPGVTGNHPMEGSAEDVARARLEDREMVRVFLQAETLPEEDRSVVKKFLNAFLTWKQIQAMAVT
jgi:hypothetical protein